MMAMLRIYSAQLRKALILQFQYRVAMMIWMIDLILQPTIYLVVWSSVASSSGGAVGGFSTGDFAAYYIILMIVTHATQIWHMWEYEYNIRMGIFSIKLLRPVHPIHEDIAQNLAYKLLMLVVVIPTVILLILVFRPTWNPPIWAIEAFPFALILAGVISFLSGWTLAMAAFWTTRIFAINQLYFVAMLFLSGYVAPLELLPTAVQSVANFVPFRWMLSFPAELLVGRVTPEQAVNGMLAQLIWIALLVAGLTLIWRAAVKRYSAVGA